MTTKSTYRSHQLKNNSVSNTVKLGSAVLCIFSYCLPVFSLLFSNDIVKRSGSCLIWATTQPEPAQKSSCFPLRNNLTKDAAGGMRCYFVRFLKKFQPDLPFYSISRTSENVVSFLGYPRPSHIIYCWFFKLNITRPLPSKYMITYFEMCTWYKQYFLVKVRGSWGKWYLP